MVLSVKEAYEVLELPLGADKDSIQNNYKKLANKWLPSKHKKCDEALLKFQYVNIAFRKLTVKETCLQTMTMTDMLSQYEKYCLQNSVASNGYHYSNSSSEDEDFESSSSKKKNSIRNKALGTKNTTNNLNEVKKSILEEEQDRQKKADKRRAKKKKRKEKKRLEKESKIKDNNLNEFSKIDAEDFLGNSNKDSSDSSAVSEEEDLDPYSAFALAVSRNKKANSNPHKNKPNKKDKLKDSKYISRKDDDEVENMEEIPPAVLQSRQLAIRGNEMANVEQYQAAVDLFTEAIKLDPRDYRFFGNRSYCYDRLCQFEKALRDADVAISLSPSWPKGYFRKGRALSGLKFYPEAENSFEQVLKLDKNCEDAIQELSKVRTYQLMEMGFPRSQAEGAIKQYGTVQLALDSLLACVAESSSLTTEVYMSDGEEYDTDDEHFHYLVKSQNPADDKMNPKNPDGLTSLWVGNVAAEMTEKMLTTMFTKYGVVTSVRILAEKHCAFVNFKDKFGAGKAMEALQGKDCFGEKLLVRFPDNPIANGQATTIIKKAKPTQTKLQPQQIQQQMLVQQANLQQLNKQTGPVNGDECYFWRTTGCIYGEKCRFRHIKDHKGIDKKPWQKNF